MPCSSNRTGRRLRTPACPRCLTSLRPLPMRSAKRIAHQHPRFQCAKRNSLWHTCKAKPHGTSEIVLHCPVRARPLHWKRPCAGACHFEDPAIPESVAFDSMIASVRVADRNLSYCADGQSEADGIHRGRLNLSKSETNKCYCIKSAQDRIIPQYGGKQCGNFCMSY